jgi:uncharacterized GH25 family protein
MKRILFIALLATRAFAHDFWIEPSTFRPAAGTTFSAALRVGEHFEGDPVPRRAARIESFVVRDASGERAVKGFEGQDPAGFVQSDEAGVVVLGYRSKANPHEISREKFLTFLNEEGVQGLKVGEGKQRERFFRFAKAVVLVERRASARRTNDENAGLKPGAPLGFRFEIVSVDDSRFQLFHEQKPLANTLVMATNRNGKTHSARTDANGTVRFPITAGVWLLKATHVIPSSDPAFQWDSLWASLTFER